MIDSSFLPPKKVAKRKTSDYAEALFSQQKLVLAQAIVRARLAQGLSQEALAYEAQVERSYVSLIERGSGNPSLRVLCQLAYRLGMDLVELLGMQLATAKSQAGTAKSHTPPKLRINIIGSGKMQDSVVPQQAKTQPLNMYVLDETPPTTIKSPTAEKPHIPAASSNRGRPKNGQPRD